MIVSYIVCTFKLLLGPQAEPLSLDRLLPIVPCRIPFWLAPVSIRLPSYAGDSFAER